MRVLVAVKRRVDYTVKVRVESDGAATVEKIVAAAGSGVSPCVSRGVTILDRPELAAAL